MADKEKYMIKVEGKLVEVTPEVYYSKIRFRLKNGLELPESIERTVR